MTMRCCFSVVVVFVLACGVVDARSGGLDGVAAVDPSIARRFGLEAVVYDTVLYAREAMERPTADMPNITLVSHATIDRLPHVARWCRTLRGPMSISVFVRPVVDDVAAVMGAFAADECIARHADLHLVTERGHTFNASAASGADGKDMMTHYPFNVQRNAALDGCVGALALLMDIDFHLMPVPNNREVDLRRHLEAQRAKVAAWPFLADEPWVVDAALYVIPAVETVSEDVSVPSSLLELRVAVSSMQACPFYGHHSKACHRPTNLRRWLTASDPYLAEYVEGYEPYVVLNKTSRTCALGHRADGAGSGGACQGRWWPLPRYNESFIGRGYSKMSFFFELAQQGRPFVVVPDFFVAHQGRGNVFRSEVFDPATKGENKVIDNGVLAYYHRQERNKRLWKSFKTAARHAYHPERALVEEAFDHGRDASEDAYEAEARHLAKWVRSRGSPFLSSQENDAATTAVPSDGCVGGMRSHDGGGGGGVCEGAVTRTVQQQRIVEDDLLWRGTSTLRWMDLASQLPPIQRDGRYYSCITNHRSFEVPEDVETKIVNGVSWACKRMDCSELLAVWEVPKMNRPMPLRYFPKHVVFEADWVFDRWFHAAVAHVGIAPEVACNFNGYARLVQRSVELGAQQLRTPPSPSATVSPLGCTLDPDYCPTRRELRDVLEEICDGVAMDGSGGRGNGGPDNGNNGGGMVPREVPDAIRGGCEHLFLHIDPLLADQLWFRVSVALNAHHMVFYGGGEGITCRRRFGAMATWTHIPTEVLDRYDVAVPFEPPATESAPRQPQPRP